MNEYSIELLQFLESRKNDKLVINDLLKANPEGIYAYYLAPLTNVIRIYQSGGIYSRNEAENYMDLSGQYVQGLREKLIPVIGRRGQKMVKLHDCVNFFLNPFNFTYYQFRRIALIRAQAGDPWSRIVCLLEVNLRRVFELEQVYWGIAGKNLAAKGTQNIINKSSYLKFRWDKIFSVGENHSQDGSNDFRAAELVVYPMEQGDRRYIPVDCINRILALDKDLHRGVNIIPSDFQVPIIPFQPPTKFQVLEDPLNNDKEWVIFLAYLQQVGIPASLIVKVLRRLFHIEEELGLSLTESFINPRIGFSDLHGVGHVMRVMFWVLFLAGIIKTLGQPITGEQVTSALYAAFFHDLCRVNNNDEASHGDMAAKRYSPFLTSLLPTQSSNQCLTAIRVHSQDREPNDDELVWRLLKDADALDRGRFGAPGRQNGCNPDKLRLSIYKGHEGLKNKILWAAYRLPRITNYINWKECACEDFVITLLSSINMVIEFEDIATGIKQMARTICTQMTFIND